MGSWSVSCGISHVCITSGDDCVILPLKENTGGEYHKYQPATLPIFGKYNDYGGMEEIVEDDNTKLIEEHFGVTIDEFVTFLVDGKFTYGREEAEEVQEKMKNLEEAAEWRFMWIDRKVYEAMLLDVDEWHKGYNDYGTAEMLTMFGFTRVPDAVCENYDSKRFNQLWRNADGAEFYADGRTLLSTGGNGKRKDVYVYHYGHKDESSLETYFNVPEEFAYLKTVSKSKTWRLMDRDKRNQTYGWLLGSRYEFDRFSARLEAMSDQLLNALLNKKTEEMTEEEKTELLELQKEVLGNKAKNLANLKLHRKYYENYEQWGDRLTDIYQLLMNLHPMSHELLPHTLYLTPQCGEPDQHQVMLNKFAEINYVKMIDREYEADRLRNLKRYTEDDLKALYDLAKQGKDFDEAVIGLMEKEIESIIENE